MLGVLVRARLRMLYNGARTAPPTQKVVISVLVLFSAFIFVGIGGVCGVMVRIAQDQGVVVQGLTPSAVTLVSKIYEYLFFFLLAGSVPFVAATLFQSEDLSLLFSTPTPPRSVVAAKLIDATVVNAAQFMVLGVPVLVGLGWAVHLNAAGWLWLLISTLFLLTLPPSATAATLLIAAKILGMRRVRVVVMLISVALGLAITLLACIGTNKVTSSGRINYTEVHQALAGKGGLHQTRVNAVVLNDNAPTWLPSSWAFDMLKDTAGDREIGIGGLEGLLRLSIGVGLMVPLSILLGQTVFVSDAFLEDPESSSVRSTSHRRRHFLLRLLPMQVAGIITKDLKYIRRDYILLGQIGTALILFVVPFIIRSTSGMNYAGNADLYGYLALAMMVLVMYMVTSVVSLSSIGIEGKSGWLVIGGPLSKGELLRSKWALSFGVSFLTLFALTLVAWAAFGWGWQVTVLALMGWVASCFGLSGLGVGLAGLFPRFIYENPAHRASIWALTLGFFLATGYLILSSIIAVVTYVAIDRGIAGTEVTIVAGAFCFFALSAVTGIVPVALAERRLKNYEWTV